MFVTVMDSVGALGTCMSSTTQWDCYCHIITIGLIITGGIHMNSSLVDRCLWIVLLPWQVKLRCVLVWGLHSSCHLLF